MSFSYEDELIWVGDIDGHINLSAIIRANEEQEKEEALRVDLDTVGELLLLNGMAISSYTVGERGISRSEWHWSKHKAEKALGSSPSSETLEHALVRALLSLGRPYAIARYAKQEAVPHSSALAASLPLGFRALLNQFIVGQGIHLDQQTSNRIGFRLQAISNVADATAYTRTRMVQSLLHEVTRDALGCGGVESLDREATRTTLSLCRLHFSIAEASLSSFAQLSELLEEYAEAREAEKHRRSDTIMMNRQYVDNWRLRHLFPLTNYYPFSIRTSLARGLQHCAARTPLTREVAVNELSIAHCGMILLRNKMYSSVRKRMQNESGG